MCGLIFVDLICPKCGGPVVWCNGGDVIYDFSSQFKATCPSCGYEDWESNFPRGKERTVEEREEFYLEKVIVESNISGDGHKMSASLFIFAARK